MTKKIVIYKKVKCCVEFKLASEIWKKIFNKKKSLLCYCTASLAFQKFSKNVIKEALNL